MAAPQRRRPADPALIIKRTFNAPRDLVFRAWTDPRLAVQWWGPKHHPAVQLDMDTRPGGRWHGALRSTEDGRMLGLGGTFREIVEPERIVFTFAWDEEGERGLETVVTITLVEREGKTVMTFRQEPFQSVEELEGHHGGWSSSFDRLDECVTGTGPPG